MKPYICLKAAVSAMSGLIKSSDASKALVIWSSPEDFLKVNLCYKTFSTNIIIRSLIYFNKLIPLNLPIFANLIRQIGFPSSSLLHPS